MKLFIVMIICLMLCACSVAPPSGTQSARPSAQAGATQFNTSTSPSFKQIQVENPVAKSGADPYVIRDGDLYYYCYSTGNALCVGKTDSLASLGRVRGKRVYTPPSGTSYSHEYWAPELHKINGEWYIYVAADDGSNHTHRMYVLKCNNSDPMDKYTMLGKISDRSDKWAIDGTVLEHNGQMYFIWSGWPGDENVVQNLYIAKMSDPMTISSKRVCISVPEYDWERRGGAINEGPAILKRDGEIYLVYSASGSWTDNYCLGLLRLVGDPMSPEGWKKSSSPVFKSTDSIFGPGHCSFTTAADGSPYMVYHANLVSGSGWGGRSVWISPVGFSSRGDLILGAPRKSVKLPVLE